MEGGDEANSIPEFQKCQHLIHEANTETNFDPYLDFQVFLFLFFTLRHFCNFVLPSIKCILAEMTDFRDVT